MTEKHKDSLASMYLRVIPPKVQMSCGIDPSTPASHCLKAVPEMGRNNHLWHITGAVKAGLRCQRIVLRQSNACAGSWKSGWCVPRGKGEGIGKGTGRACYTKMFKIPTCAIKVAVLYKHG